MSQASLDGIRNPAFLRHHPSLPLIYAATESIVEHGALHARPARQAPSGAAWTGLTGARAEAAGTIVTLAYDEASRSPALCVKGEQSAHGASTCYLALSAVATGRRWMLAGDCVWTAAPNPRCQACDAEPDPESPALPRPLMCPPLMCPPLMCPPDVPSRSRSPCIAGCGALAAVPTSVC